MSSIVLIPAVTYERGVRVPDWDNAARVAEDWRLTPLSDLELQDDGRQGSLTTLRATGPYPTRLTYQCRLEVDGVAYECDWQPKYWPSLTGGLAHTEAVLKQVTG